LENVCRHLLVCGISGYRRIIFIFVVCDSGFMDEFDEMVAQAIEKGVSLSRLKSHFSLTSESDAARLRAAVLERKMGVDLSSVKSLKLDFDVLVGRNIENPVGGVVLPVGVVGPLLVDGSFRKGEVFLPLATTEGALVASANRGAKATYLSGGVKARVIGDRMTRAPVFRTGSIDESVRLREWVETNFEELRRIAASTTKHGRLEGAECFIVGTNVFVRFSYSTGDAMGMNMVTIATDRVAEYIEKETGAKLVALSGNVCSDKKPAYINTLMGRGKSVVAECTLPREVLSGVLRTTAEEINEINVRKNMLGSSVGGSLAQNAHFANIVAASFIAMGQDAAQVVESSQGFCFTEVRSGGDLYFSVTLPSLEVGAVGGGTRLETQRELLSLTGVFSVEEGMRSKWLAEVIAAGVLSGELSLLAAMASDELAGSHSRLGRGGEAKG
jgi:hydroxymethylglutaryl-CoA reductase (NADPH)